MIKVDQLRKNFGSIVAVDGISFEVQPGEVLGFLGPNGAGKSTTMKILTCFLSPDGGSAQVAGCDILTDPVGVRQRVGYVPEHAPLYDDMTVHGFLSFIGDVRGIGGARLRDAIDRVVSTCAIDKVVHRRIDTLSKGFKRRVGLAQAFLHDPSTLILDEPTDGLDPNQKFEVRELIRTMGKQKCIVISTHILEEVDAVCSRAIIIAKGRVLADGTPAELTKRGNGKLDAYFRQITTAAETAGSAA